MLWPMHQHHQHLHAAQRDVGQHAPSLATSPAGRRFCASRNHPRCAQSKPTILQPCALRHRRKSGCWHPHAVRGRARAPACVLHTAAATCIVARCCSRCGVSSSGRSWEFVDASAPGGYYAAERAQLPACCTPLLGHSLLCAAAVNVVLSTAQVFL